MLQKQERGCTTDTYLGVKILGQEYKRCPRRPVLDHPDRFAYWLQLYRNYKRGVMPEPGSYMEQSYVVLRVFNILDAIYGRIDEYRDQERARKNNPSGGGGKFSSRGA